jgi:hypothetical protein
MSIEQNKSISLSDSPMDKSGQNNNSFDFKGKEVRQENFD